jgi:hypothetical protein
MARGEHRHAPRRSCASYQNGNGGGYEVIGEVRRKSKHFEEESAAFEEFHIELGRVDEFDQAKAGGEADD